MVTKDLRKPLVCRYHLPRDQWHVAYLRASIPSPKFPRSLNADFTSANTYISYTSLDDDVDATKCFGADDSPGDMNGPRGIRYCADGGVYYLNKLSDTDINSAKIGPPNGFDSVTNFGIYPWFPPVAQQEHIVP